MRPRYRRFDGKGKCKQWNEKGNIGNSDNIEINGLIFEYKQIIKHL